MNVTHGIVYSETITKKYRGGFYYPLATQLDKISCNFIKERGYATTTKLFLLNYTQGARSMPNKTAKNIVNHYQDSDYKWKCTLPSLDTIESLQPVCLTGNLTIDLTSDGHKAVAEKMKDFAKKLADDLDFPFQVVPLLVIKPIDMDSARIKEVNRNDRVFRLSSPLLGGYVGFANYLEGFYPGVVAFLQQGWLAQKDLVVSPELDSNNITLGDCRVKSPVTSTVSPSNYNMIYF
uniref:Uncharacterized protein n=1 Tax=Ditylenchus dipsaci TaxID=166011 RepID=A0A915DRC8_9BILA